jgi:prephenate dehydratase
MDTKNIIAFQGVAGAHSDMACKKAFPNFTTLPCQNFEDVFSAVKENKAELGLIPIENSHAGRVAEIHNLLPSSGLHIVGEYFHTVRHNLVGIKGTKREEVKKAFSHTQALMQCRKYLLKNNIEPLPYFDTAGAAKHVAERGDRHFAAISSDLAADLYGLEIIEADIQDSQTNRTLFVGIADEPIDPAPNNGTILTSMLFTTRNISAGLYKALGGFATNSVNILKLESYIPDYSSGTAQFFITFEGHPSQKHVQAALEELGFFTKQAELLGIYPADKERYK